TPPRTRRGPTRGVSEIDPGIGRQCPRPDPRTRVKAFPAAESIEFDRPPGAATAEAVPCRRGRAPSAPQASGLLHSPTNCRAQLRRPERRRVSPVRLESGRRAAPSRRRSWRRLQLLLKPFHGPKPKLLNCVFGALHQA